MLERLEARAVELGALAGADAVIVNTCGFLDSAKAESLEAIGEALGRARIEQIGERVEFAFGEARAVHTGAQKIMLRLGFAPIGLTAPSPAPSIAAGFSTRLFASMDLSEIRAPVAEDMQAVDQLILRRLESDVVLINQIGHYIVGSGGKRLRPLLVLLAAKACGYQGARHLDMAAIVEFLLLHEEFPQYQWHRNKGYPTRAHREALQNLPCEG